ncbi:MAG TPA: acyloxyacyl hydrolase [Thermoanaerobaculia bacterium]|nr:acyloxyacyl hydrolase [Thermoanaerobaculia bacterium]
MTRSRIAVLVLLLSSVLPAAAENAPSRLEVVATVGRSIQGLRGQATVRSLALEYARSLTPRFQVVAVAAPYVIEQPKSWFGDLYNDGNEIVKAGSLVVLARHHPRTESRRFQPFVEIGTGPIWATRRVPAATSHFNFISQAGAGVIVQPQRPVSLIVGYRFAHISNGGYAPRNPGLNVNSFFIGTTLRLH